MNDPILVNHPAYSVLTTAYRTVAEPLLGEVIFNNRIPSDSEGRNHICDLDDLLQLNGPVAFAFLNELKSKPEYAALRRYCDWREAPKVEYLIVYGTLKVGYRNFKALNLKPHTTLIEQITVQGELYNLGSYPGLIPGNSPIQAELFRIKNPQVLPMLDQLEGWQRSLKETYYRRQCIPVALENGDSIDAWIYYFNQSIEGFPRLQVHCWTEAI